MMSLSARASALRSAVHKSHKHEAANLLAAAWHGKVTAQQKALSLVRLSRKRLGSMIDNAEALPSANAPHLQEARDALGTMILDIAETINTAGDSVENRLAKLDDYKAVVGKEVKNYAGLSGVAAASKHLLDFIKKAKTVSAFLREVAEEPIKYAKLALDFVNGKARSFMIKYLSKALGWASGKVAAALGKTIPQADEAAAYSAYLWASGGADLSEFPRLAKFMEGAVAVLKIATICVQIVTTFFVEMAQKGSWANAVTKAVVMGGVAAGTIAVSTGLATAITATLNATLAGLSVSWEAPPVAGVILAAGLLIVAGIAVAKLFDMLINSCFGNFSIAPSMRLPMSVSLVATLDSSVSASMSSSLLPD